MTAATTTVAMITTVVSSTGQIIVDFIPILQLFIGILLVGFCLYIILNAFKFAAKKIKKW